MRKIRKKTWLKIIGLSGVTLLVVWGGLQAVTAYKLRKWDGRQRFTTVDLINPVTVRSFDPTTKEGTAVILPDNLIIETVDGRGKWRAEVMPQMAKKFGRVWATDSVCDYLTVPCTALSSDLTWFDRISWWKWGREVRWKTVDLAETALIREVEAPDGEREQILAPEWKAKAYDWFASGEIIRENLNVTIVNATPVGGLGSHAAGTVETAGMKVVMIKNSDEVVDKCWIEGSSETLNRLGTIWLIKKFNCTVRNGEEGLGEIVLTLGTDYAKWLWGDDYSSALGISVN